MPQIRVVSSAIVPVQLVDLLKRLSADERATLVERRLGPNAVPPDARALAEQLANRTSTLAALAQINSGQLLLLRWLATQPSQLASWSELKVALGDRLPSELLQSYLEDLRLWGLADFDPSPRNGFFATYPAVTSNLPAGREAHLKPHLESLNSDALMRVCNALGVKSPPSRKESRIDLVLSLLATDSVRSLVESLSPPARELFAWVREQGGWVDAGRMTQRVPRSTLNSSNGYGTYVTFWREEPARKSNDPLTELVRVRLLLPLFTYGNVWYPPTAFAIAVEVAQAYSSLELLDSSPLVAPRVEPAEQVEGTVPDPLNLLRDIGHLLGFIGAGRAEWRQDGGPYKRSLVALGKMLGQKDGTYAEVLWDLAVSAGLVRRTYGGTQSRYEPVPLDDVNPPELIEGLILAWIQAGATVHTHGHQARARLFRLLRLLPPDTWMLRSSVEAALRFHWPLIFAPEYQYPGTPVPDPGWSSLGSLILGLGTTPDGQAAVMLPAAHQRLLESDPASGAEVFPPWDSSWIVQPDRTIVVPPNAAPAALTDLWKVAQLQSSHGASVFRVTPDSVAAAMNRGLTPDEVTEILERGSKVPLPPTVERLIGDQGQKYGRIKVGLAHTYVRTDDPALLKELRRNKKLAKLDWQEIAPGIAFVVSSDPDAVLGSLRQAGYLPVMEHTEKKKKKKTARTLGADGLPELRLVKGSGGKGSRASEPTLHSGRDELIQIINTAIAIEMPLTVTWVHRGLPTIAELEVIDLHGNELHAYNLDHDDGYEVMVPLEAIIDVQADVDLLDDGLRP